VAYALHIVAVVDSDGELLRDVLCRHYYNSRTEHRGAYRLWHACSRRNGLEAKPRKIISNLLAIGGSLRMKYSVANALCLAMSFGVLLNAQTQPTPEPGTIMMMGAGLVGLGVVAWKRNRQK
jgi:hypothetical protein